MEMTTIYSVMADYDRIHKSAMEDYSATEKKIRADYGDSKIGQQKLTEAMNLRDTTIEAAQNTGVEAVEKVFSALTEKLSEAITAPVPADFVSTLEAIKAMGKMLSLAEANMYLQKYNGNYTAYRSLVSVFNGLGMTRFISVSYDEISNEMESCKSLAKNFFKRGISGYMYRVLLADDNPLKTFDNAISCFLSGDIQGYVDTMHSPEEAGNSRYVSSNY